MNRIVFAVATALLLLVAQRGFACGVIAFNPSNHAWGRAYDANLAEGMNKAIRACNNSCGVYAWSCSTESTSVIVFSRDNHWAVYSDRDLGRARHRAQELCGRDCDGFASVSNK